MANKPTKVLNFKIFSHRLADEILGLRHNKNTINIKGISTPIIKKIRYQIPYKPLKKGINEQKKITIEKSITKLHALCIPI
jgi:hypothetical protein